MSAPTLSRTPSSPTAIRPSRPGWRDPRLALGVGLVALCAVLGARLVGSADDTVAVWVVRADTVAGVALDESDLERTRVHFDSGSDADRYLSADSALPTGTVLTRAVGAGELLPTAALGAATDLDLVELPLTVASNAVPATVRPGAVIDVWVTPADDEGTRKATLVLDDVSVLALPGPGSSLSVAAERQVIVGLDRSTQQGLADSLARLATGTVVITRQAGR